MTFWILELFRKSRFNLFKLKSGIIGEIALFYKVSNFRLSFLFWYWTRRVFVSSVNVSQMDGNRILCLKTRLYNVSNFEINKLWLGWFYRKKAIPVRVFLLSKACSWGRECSKSCGGKAEVCVTWKAVAFFTKQSLLTLRWRWFREVVEKEFERTINITWSPSF